MLSNHPSDPGGDAKEVGQRMPAEETCATRTDTRISDQTTDVKQNDFESGVGTATRGVPECALRFTSLNS